ncbi:MAG TPA: HWE histidine kinase domain-containing protein [Caulobacteraceae bacterium]|jgi:PAS domain S-box-containing protein|nr:HWE histidine kinase domain-containing protein [Caulobacteraceae bacterium]
MDDGARHTRNVDPSQLALEHQRASLALSAARMGEFEWDVPGNRLLVSERMAAVLGLAVGDQAQSDARAHVHPDDQAAVEKAVQAGLETHDRFEVEFRYLRPDDGALIWVQCIGATVPGPDGQPGRVLGIVEDVTRRKAEDSARNTLVAELDHRVKNVLASVQSLAAQSARRTTSLDAFLKTFAGRLEAMASAHTLLTATRWRGADIGNIAAAELGGLAPGQARWAGPEIVLNPRATNALTLALHELATNAVKFGALSADGGRVEVSWTRKLEGGFELIWTERGGPPVNQPERRGFGVTLLERVTGRELGGAAKLEFRAGGARATISADVTALAAGAAAAQPLPEKQPEARPAAQAGASAGVMMPAGAVKDLRILIVEDAVLLALELEAGLTEAGARVVGMAADVEEALKLAETPFDVAVLDANLNGTPVTPVAAALTALGKPFIFATGYGDAAPAPEGFDAPVVRKPYNVAQIAAAVAEALARRTAG